MIWQSTLTALSSHSLTDRQAEVLARAHEFGDYDRPRGATDADLADRLDISEPTVHKHLRAAEQKLAAAMFDRPRGVSPTDTQG